MNQLVNQLVVEWGKTDYKSQTFKDAKVWSTPHHEGAVTWDWNNDGTRHESGTTFEAVEEVLKHNPQTIILTKGFDGKLNVPPVLIKHLMDLGMEVICKKTQSAVHMFNYLVSQNESVAILVHSTC